MLAQLLSNDQFRLNNKHWRVSTILHKPATDKTPRVAQGTVNSLEYLIRMTNKEMREPTFLILTALAGGRKHGYSLIAEAGELSAQRVQLKVGTLYAALDRLAAEGLVTAAGDEVVDGRLRRYYELTDSGAATLSDAAERSLRIAAEAQMRLKRNHAAPVVGAKVSVA